VRVLKFQDPQFAAVLGSTQGILLQWTAHSWWWYSGVHSLQTHCQTM